MLPKEYNVNFCDQVMILTDRSLRNSFRSLVSFKYFSTKVFKKVN